MSKTVFEKGDFVVILRDPSHDSVYIKNGYCFVAGQTDINFNTNKDLKGTDTTASFVRFDKPQNWRYATEQEIAEYKRLGGPFLVSTLPKNQVIENYEIY